MEALLALKKAISVAKTDHLDWCRHSLPNSKVLSPQRSFGIVNITKLTEVVKFYTCTA